MANLACSVDIYPRDGGQYTFHTQNILRIQTASNLRDGSEKFTIVLAPGGPSGDTGPSWAQILTPMSVCVIAMERGDISNVVMVGVVTDANETQVWNPGQNVIRNTVINGMGFSYFMKTISVYALTYLSGFNDLFQNLVPGAQTPSLSASFIGSPTDVAIQWLQNPTAALPSNYMGGLSPIKVRYNGNVYSISDVLSSVFVDDGFYSIPLASFFIATEGTWDIKMRQILEWPFYEYFVLTGPQDFYSINAGDYTTTIFPSQLFSSQSLTNAKPAIATLVGRRNPYPNLTAGAQDADLTLWNALPKFKPKYGGFIQSNQTFSIDGVRNVFGINSVFAYQIYANLGEKALTLLFELNSAVNVDSISRYGFYPEIHFTNYYAQTNLVNTENSETIGASDALVRRLASWYGPIPQLAVGTVTMELRPDIFPGSRFSYYPFRDQQEWTYYIEGVAHTFDFMGSQSSTTLQMDRGLPSYIYEDQSMVYDLLRGNLVRKDGQYTETNSSLPTLTLGFLKDSQFFSNLLYPATNLYSQPKPPS